MPRLIYADALDISKFTRWFDDPNDRKAVERMIRDAPTIDPVHAAGGCYCGECKYWTGGFDGRCLMHSRGEDVIWFSYASDFCRRGKRREG